MSAFAESARNADRPCCISTRLRVIAKPRPVPPKRLLILVSACVNFSKIISSLSWAMPIPVSETVNTIASASDARSVANRSFLRELHSVVQQVRQYLPQTQWIADGTPGHRPR